MKILLHAAVDISLPGGVETHLRELALGLMARGHEVEIHARPASLAPFRMVPAMDHARYDIVHDHGTAWPGAGPHPRYLRTAHFCTRAKMAVYVRMGRLKTLANLGNWRAVRGERAAARAGVRWIAVSERLRQELIRGYGVSPQRVVNIPNGASFGAPSIDRAALRARWGLPPEAPLLLTIGRRDFVKGFDLLERAWERVRRPRHATWIMIGGEREQRGPGRIATGPLPHEALVDFLHAADFGAFPSYYEGCGIVLLDMLAAGLYTLTHEVGIAREVIVPRVNGELIPRDLAAWSAALERRLVMPRARVAPLPPERGWSAMVDRVEALYQALVQGATAAPVSG